jgi:transposase-like protein
MEFPIIDLLQQEECEAWIIAHFHPGGLKCPTCGASVTEASPFRRTEKSQLTVYRCRRCRHVYNLYSGTLFQQRHLRPAQVVLLMRGVLKGEASNVLAVELGLHYLTVLQLRRAIQKRAQQMQPTTPLDDLEVESDELFQNAGEKRSGTLRPG